MMSVLSLNSFQQELWSTNVDNRMGKKAPNKFSLTSRLLFLVKLRDFSKNL